MKELTILAALVIALVFGAVNVIGTSTYGVIDNVFAQTGLLFEQRDTFSAKFIRVK